MKRFISTMLAAILVIACLAGTVLAADTATISGSTDTTVAGGTAKVTFSITEADFASYSVKLSYDKEVLALTGVSKVGGSGMLDYSAETGKVAYAYSKNETVSGGLFTATFDVSADAKPGEYPVEITVSHVSEANLDGLTISAVNGKVIIEEPVCDHNWVLVDSKESTCIEQGYEKYECSKCGETKTVTLDYADHILTGWLYDDEDYKKGHWHECTVCGEIFDHGEHGDWQYDILKEPTKEEDGLKKITCGTCGWYYTQKIDKDLDDGGVPGNDITPVIALSVTSVITLAGTSLYVFKRKNAK